MDALTWELDRERRYESSDTHWDVFISYASENTDLARGIADRLFLQRFTPWFADYEIILHNLSDFQSAIKLGLRRSSASILLISKSYIGKDWPEYERRCIHKQSTLSGHHAIPILIDVDEDEYRRKYPDLAANSRVAQPWRLTSPEDIVIRFQAWNKDSTAIPDAKQEPPTKEKTWRFTDKKFGFSLEFGTDWQRVARFRCWLDTFKAGVDAVTAFFNPKIGLTMNIYSGPMDLNSIIPNLSQDEYPEIDLLNHQRNFAKRFSRQFLGAHLPFGLHRVELWNRQHFMFSYIGRDGCFRRKYALVRPDTLPSRAIEHVLTVNFGPNIDTFFQYVDEIDSIVHSLS